MRFGFTMPNRYGIEDAGAMLALGPRAEELGYDSLWVSEHLFSAGAIGRDAAGGPIYEPLTTLTYLAAATRSVRLGTTVLVLPYHHPVNLAKEVATLDAFSGGRVNLGVGVGGLEEEFRGLGANFADRGAVTDEVIDSMVALWTQDLPCFTGRHYRFSGMAFSPKPLQKPHPPIFVGGVSRRALRRTARVGQWWHPGSSMDPATMRECLAYLKEQTKACCRDPSEVQVSVKLYLDFPEVSGAGPTSSPSGRHFSGTPDDVIRLVRSYEEMGVQHVLLNATSRDLGVITGIMELFAQKVIPAF